MMLVTSVHLEEDDVKSEPLMVIRSDTFPKQGECIDLLTDLQQIQLLQVYSRLVFRISTIGWDILGQRP